MKNKITSQKIEESIGFILTALATVAILLVILRLTIEDLYSGPVTTFGDTLFLFLSAIGLIITTICTIHNIKEVWKKKTPNSHKEMEEEYLIRIK